LAQHFTHNAFVDKTRRTGVPCGPPQSPPEGTTMNGNADSRARKPLSRWWRWLLALPFIALLWVPSYNAVEPLLWGVPFFYWYQFLWLLITSALLIFLFHWAE
jgi:hypothetical protein